MLCPSFCPCPVSGQPGFELPYPTYRRAPVPRTGIVRIRRRWDGPRFRRPVYGRLMRQSCPQRFHPDEFKAPAIRVKARKKAPRRYNEVCGVPSSTQRSWKTHRRTRWKVPRKPPLDLNPDAMVPYAS